MAEQMFVCLYVGRWRANGNPIKPLHLSKEGFGAGLTPAPSPPGSGGPETA